MSNAGKPDSQICLETTERQLDRIQSFFSRIDAKVSALFAIATGQIAIGAINLRVDDLQNWWIWLPGAIYLVVVGYAMVSLYYCMYPHLEGGHASLVYFREIAKLREAEYVDRYTTLTQSTLQKDVVGQIWRNSQIVAIKFDFLKRATIALLFAMIPWTILLIAVSVGHGKLPAIS